MGARGRQALGVQRYVRMGSIFTCTLSNRDRGINSLSPLLIVSLKPRAFPLESVVFGKGASSSIQLRPGPKGISLRPRLCSGLSHCGRAPFPWSPLFAAMSLPEGPSPFSRFTWQLAPLLSSESPFWLGNKGCCHILSQIQRERTSIKIHNKVFFKSHHECKILSSPDLSERLFSVKGISRLFQHKLQAATWHQPHHQHIFSLAFQVVN